MFFLIQFILLVVLFSTQITLLEKFAFAGITPDLALIYVIFCAIHFQDNRGIGMGFVVGLMQDVLSGGLLGVNTLSKSLIAFIFSSLKDKIMMEGVVPIFFFMIAASILDGFIYYLVMITLLKGELPASFLFSSLPVYAIYNAMVGPLIFYGLDINRKWIIRRFPNPFLRQT